MQDAAGKKEHRLSLAVKMNLVTTGMILLVAGGLLLISYIVQGRRVTAMYYNRVETAATNAADLVDPDLLRSFRDKVLSEKFSTVRDAALSAGNPDIVKNYLESQPSYYYEELRSEEANSGEGIDHYESLAFDYEVLSYDMQVARSGAVVTDVYIQYDKDGVTWNLVDPNEDFLYLGSIEEELPEFAAMEDNGYFPATVHKSRYGWLCSAYVPIKDTETGEAIAVVGADVALVRGDETLWQTKTDNRGEASLWAGLYKEETADSAALTVRIGTELMEGHPQVARWDSVAAAPVNRYVVKAATDVKPQADIAFIVDATGSMADEINFLKSDLVDIIDKAAAASPALTLRTAALFYRDEGDEYVTKHSDFTTKVSETADYVGQQQAMGGGDYPEAVHTALDQMLQQLSWDTEARSRLAFLILDAPAHHETDVIRSLQLSIGVCARMGIKLIPVAASGVDKNTEFMLRFFAIATGGTYVFLTNHSGVGLDHIAASVGDYEVEPLNSLIVRLIGEYTE